MLGHEYNDLSYSHYKLLYSLNGELYLEKRSGCEAPALCKCFDSLPQVALVRWR